MKISESQLLGIIEESIKKNLLEYELKQKIKQMIRESIMSMGGLSRFEDEDKDDDEDEKDHDEHDDYEEREDHDDEKDDDEDEDDKKDDEVEKKPLHNPDGVSDQNNETEEEQQLRSSVEGFFTSSKDVGRTVDIAGYAYELYNVSPKPGEDTNEMKNARSKFDKCLYHRANDQGYPYSFSTMEINRLASMISSNNKMNESIKKRK